MQGIFAGRTQLRYPYGRYGYTRGGGKIWHACRITKISVSPAKLSVPAA